MGVLIGIFLFGLAMTGLVALGLIFALSFKEPESMDKLVGFGEARAAESAGEETGKGSAG